MTFVIWLVSLFARPKPRPVGWATENQDTWTPAADAKARTEIQTRLRRDLGKETP